MIMTSTLHLTQRTSPTSRVARRIWQLSLRGSSLCVLPFSYPQLANALPVNSTTARTRTTRTSSTVGMTGYSLNDGNFSSRTAIPFLSSRSPLGMTTASHHTSGPSRARSPIPRRGSTASTTPPSSTSQPTSPPPTKPGPTPPSAKTKSTSTRALTPKTQPPPQTV